MNAKTQIRGICQCCGRNQAVMKGTMAKHGYTVENGWFQGACSGDNFAPMQASREQTDRIIAQVEAEIVHVSNELGKVIAGELKPTHVERRVRELGKMVTKQVPFDALMEHEKKAAVRNLEWKLENRIKAGRNFVEMMKSLADKYHGTELFIVAAPAATVHIEKGEKRQSVKHVLIARYQDGARVYWKTLSGLQGWTGSKAWRALPIVDSEENHED